MVRVMARVQLKDSKRSKYLMLALTDTIDTFPVANSISWHGHVMTREDGHVLRRTLDFEVDGERKKGRPWRTWRNQVWEESEKVGLRRKNAHCRSKWSVGNNQIVVRLR